MTTNVTFLLDRTGSMEPIKDDTIGGFNAYLETLQKSGEGITFSLSQFDSQSLDKICVKVPVKDVVPLNHETYQPRATTPLIDAAYKTISEVKDELGTKQVIIIQTDGQENASREFTLEQLKALIEERTAKGWQFIFMGAGIDAYTAAQEMGIMIGKTLSHARSHMRETFKATADATVRYSSGMEPEMNYTVDEKRKAGDTSR